MLHRRVRRAALLTAGAVLIVTPSVGGAGSPPGVSLADVGLTAGAVIDNNTVDAHTRVIPPGIRWAIAQGWRLRVVAPRSIPMPRAYREATEKYAGQVRLARGGLALENYVAGLPFPNLDPNDPDAVMKIMWNFYYNFTVTDDVAQRNFETNTGPVRPNAPMDVERHYIVDQYRKLNYTGRLYVDPKPELPNPEGVRFKESVHPIIEPFDLKGVGATFYRYLDPDKQDDSWLYLPQLRRVRRLSTAQRSDALFGQDTDADAFNGYNGHIAWMDYKLLGEQVVLASMHAEQVPVKWQTPEDWLFEDVWEPRRVYVVEATSKLTQYAYSKRVLFIDRETFAIPTSDSYDRAGQLWRVWVSMLSAKKEATPWAKLARYEDEMLFLHAAIIMDVQLSHCTSTAIPSPRTRGEDSVLLNLGEKSGTSESFFTIAHLIGTGR
jgi:hypothetical protein